MALLATAGAATWIFGASGCLVLALGLIRYAHELRMLREQS
jgi:hypothetical protein